MPDIPITAHWIDCRDRLPHYSDYFSVLMDTHCSGRCIPQPDYLYFEHEHKKWDTRKGRVLYWREAFSMPPWYPAAGDETC
jgi:hypothetical protein